MELRSIDVYEADLIERLFQEVYGKEKGIDYWKWCFKNPYGYINTGLLENNRLVGYYAAHFTKNSACMIAPLVHPNYNIEMIFKKLSEDLHYRISTNRSFIYTFSNDNMGSLLLKEGFFELYQIKEYRIPIKANYDLIENPIFNDYNNYMIWRYRNHPSIVYTHKQEAVFSLGEDKIQIVDYDDIDDLYGLVHFANQVGYWERKKFISFWCETELDYPFQYIPLWKYYKIFNKDISIEDIMSIDKLRMGMK